MTLPWIVAFCFLAGVVFLLCVLFLALARHVAALATRLPQPVPLELEQGPDVGSELLREAFADPFAESALERSIVVVFLSTTCSACYQLIGGLNRFARDWEDRVVTWAVISGQPEDAKGFQEALPRTGSILDRDGTVSRMAGIGTVPFGLMYEGGLLRAKGVVNSRNMLENLAQGLTRREGDEVLARAVGASIEH